MLANNIEKVSCLICNSDRFVEFSSGTRHLNIEPPLSVMRCSSCRLLFLNPRPSANARTQIFAGQKPSGLESYLFNLANYGSVTKSRKELFSNRVKVLAEKYFLNGTNVNVLDIGASSGEFMEAVLEFGWVAIGVEPSTSGVTTAKAKGLHVVQAPAEQLPFPDQSFDLVHSNHVFEHLADPMAAAKEAYRVLKPGGIVFIEVPNQFDNIQFFRYRLMGSVPVRERNIRSIHHLVFFSRKSLRALLHRAGFENIVIKDKYGEGRRGLAYLGSLLIRFIGLFYLGAPVIQAIASKRK
ncbi:MAG: methyltransferase domain-containing protein [Cyclobacteriaceae bacterium]|nr:methyltransferase domain-containing protein [Cyclobacteriaceae bacterium]